jgi:hypothetical protein
VNNHLPFDIELRYTRLLCKYRANEFVDVLSWIGSDDASSSCVFFERRFVLSLESSVPIIRVDVVSDTNKLLIVVGASEENNGYSDEI